MEKNAFNIRFGEIAIAPSGPGMLLMWLQSWISSFYFFVDALEKMSCQFELLSIDREQEEFYSKNYIFGWPSIFPCSERQNGKHNFQTEKIVKLIKKTVLWCEASLRVFHFRFVQRYKIAKALELALAPCSIPQQLLQGALVSRI